ncbi:MAG: hypothetical protein ABDK94_10720 [Atribacterota bacterium]
MQRERTAKAFRIPGVLLTLLILFIVLQGFSQGDCQSRATHEGKPIPELKVEWEEVLTNETIKMNGLTWDGENFWVITYQSSPIAWQIAKLDGLGKVVFAFSVPCKSRDDIHNSGFTNLAWDGEFIWANNWNEGKIYCYSTSGYFVKSFEIPSLGQLIPVGIAWDGDNLWILHWSTKTVYEVDRDGQKTGRALSLASFKPSLDAGLAWDGSCFWVGSKGSNLAVRVSPSGEAMAFVRGPRTSGSVRDLTYDNKYLYWIYQQGHTIYRAKISDNSP